MVFPGIFMCLNNCATKNIRVALIFLAWDTNYIIEYYTELEDGHMPENILKENILYELLI